MDGVGDQTDDVRDCVGCPLLLLLLLLPLLPRRGAEQMAAAAAAAARGRRRRGHVANKCGRWVVRQSVSRASTRCAGIFFRKEERDSFFRAQQNKARQGEMLLVLIFAQRQIDADITTAAPSHQPKLSATKMVRRTPTVRDTDVEDKGVSPALASRS